MNATSTPSVDNTPPVVVTRDMLSQIVLSLENVNSEFPDLKKDAEGVGDQDNVSAASITKDPTDTAKDLEASGRVHGYNSAYSSEDLSLTVVSSVDMFETSDSATSFLARHLADYNEFEGVEISQGLLIKEFKEIAPPAIGTDTRRGQYIAIALGFDVYGNDENVAMPCRV